MATVKWQCKQCGAIMTMPQGMRPPIGSFCGKAKDHRHRWVKISFG